MRSAICLMLSGGTSHQFSKCVSRPLCPHQRFANQEGVISRHPQFRDIFRRTDSTLRNSHHACRELFSEIERRLQVNFERPQIARIDADQITSSVYSPL